jgi:hypothetical protein
MSNLDLELQKSYFTSIGYALSLLRPNSKFVIRGTSYDGIEWLEKPVYEGGQKKPTIEEVEAEIARLQQEWENFEYQRLRAKEYPDFKEYLDGIVKGDTAQMQAYIDACLAVKAKYPKPESVEE